MTIRELMSGGLIGGRDPPYPEHLLGEPQGTRFPDRT